MSYVVLALKWRPQTFDEVAGQEAIAQTLKNAIRTGRTAHAFLFTGPRGVGKTSTARILAKALNCERGGPTPDPCNECDACREITSGRSLDVLEIDGASNRGIDDIRELRESVRYASTTGRTKIYIIDEVHMLTTDAFNALLKTLEEPPPHVVFVLATTEPLKLPATIVSRCQRYDFSRLRSRDTMQRLRLICDAEGIEITDDALSLIARRAEGSMRDALTLLDQVVAGNEGPHDADGVAASLGIAGRALYFSICEAILDADPRRAMQVLGSAYEEGQNLQEVAEEMVGHLRDVLVLTLGEGTEDLVDAVDTERERLKEQAARGKPADLLRMVQIGIDAATRMRRSPFPRVVLEVALTEMCLLPRAADLAQLLRRLPKGEERIPGGTGGASAPIGGAEHAAHRPTASGLRGASPSRTASGPSASAAPVPPPLTFEAPKPAPGRAGGTTGQGPRGGPATAQAVVHEEPVAPPAPEAVADDPWAQVLLAVRRSKPALAAALNGSSVVGEEGGYLLVRVPGGADGFQKTTLESTETRPFLQKIVQEIYGRPLGWKVQAGDPPPDESRPQQASAEPASPRRPKDATYQPQGRSNLADIRRIAEKMDGEILGPT